MQIVIPDDYQQLDFVPNPEQQADDAWPWNDEVQAEDDPSDLNPVGADYVPPTPTTVAQDTHDGATWDRHKKQRKEIDAAQIAARKAQLKDDQDLRSLLADKQLEQKQTAKQPETSIIAPVASDTDEDDEEFMLMFLNL